MIQIKILLVCVIFGFSLSHFYFKLLTASAGVAGGGRDRYLQISGQLDYTVMKRKHITSQLHVTFLCRSSLTKKTISRKITRRRKSQINVYIQTNTQQRHCKQEKKNPKSFKKLTEKSKYSLKQSRRLDKDGTYLVFFHDMIQVMPVKVVAATVPLLPAGEI